MSTEGSKAVFARAVAFLLLLGPGALAGKPLDGPTGDIPTREIEGAPGPAKEARVSGSPGTDAPTGGTPVHDPPTLDAAKMLARFEEILAGEPAGEDYLRVAGDLEYQRRSHLPRIRLRQDSSWTFGGGAGLGMGVVLAIPVHRPDSVFLRQLAEKRLELVEHNIQAERNRRLDEFRRTLRLLAHIEEAEELLAGHREELLLIRPEWRSLEQGRARDDGRPLEENRGSTAVSREQLAYLEIVQALARTRRERTLLLGLVAARLQLPESRLAQVRVGRPPPRPGGDWLALAIDCETSNDEIERAELMLQEAQISRAADGASAQVRVDLDLSGDVTYRPQSEFMPAWQAGLSASLRVELPASARVSGAVTVEGTPDSLSQELTLSWPRSPAPYAEGGGGEAELSYRKTIGEAKLAAVQARHALEDAGDTLRLRRIELAGVNASSSRPGAARGPQVLSTRAQARLALLNAELQHDLAVMEVLQSCGAES